MLTNRFDYTPISRESVNGKRMYTLPDGRHAPSVTTILDRTKAIESVTALKNWRARVGNAKATEITTEAASVGTVMHKLLENYCIGEIKPKGTNLVQKIAHPMAEQIILNGLVHMSEIWGVEIGLYYPGLYAGTADGAGIWKGKEAIFDFKQTNKPKKEEYIQDYYCQLAAYATSHNLLHGTNIQTGVVMMCSRDKQYQEFVLTGDRFAEYTNKWWDRVRRFYEFDL